MVACMQASPRKRKSHPSPSPPRRRSLRVAQIRTRLEPDPHSLSSGSPGTTVHDFQDPSEDSGPSFEMELALAPPDRIPAGTKLGAPLVVTFKASKLKRRPATAAGAGDGQDLSGVWAYISLMNEDKSRSLAPPRTDLLRGDPAASIYPLASEADRDTFAYAIFPDLEILKPGRYCFRINIIDMNSGPGEESQSETAKLLPAIYTQVFEAAEGAQPMSRQGRFPYPIIRSRTDQSPDPKIEAIFSRLRALGVRL